jgi:hypothetical protein
MGVCSRRGADYGETLVPGYLSTDNPGSLGGAYSSDIGRILTRSTDASKYVFAVGCTAARTTAYASTIMQMIGYLASIEADPTTEGSTNKIYISRFDPIKEYEITYSTLYSATLPSASDIGNYIGIGNTTTVAGCVLSMANCGSTGVGSGTTSPRPFIITGYDNNRRKIYCRPAVDSGQFTW